MEETSQTPHFDALMDEVKALPTEERLRIWPWMIKTGKAIHEDATADVAVAGKKVGWAMLILAAIWVASVLVAGLVGYRKGHLDSTMEGVRDEVKALRRQVKP